MNKEQRGIVRDAVLQCRSALEDDIGDRLRHFGIQVDKEPLPLERLKHLDESEIQIRKDLQSAIQKGIKAGLQSNDGILHYIKEVSFTYLNRFAAVRALEVRRIIPEVLIKRKEFGNKSRGHRNWVEVAGELVRGEPDEGLGTFLNSIFDEIGQEVKILFDISDEYSLLFPSPATLNKVIKILTETIGEDVWYEDEIIGWIYQYFIEQEKDRIFERAVKEKRKIEGNDIAVVTQLFTPRWIVKWIIENSLGVMWSEMKNGKRSKKSVSDIKFLDPACGSGHFLVYAFDYFMEMYLEEGTIPRIEIPNMILKNNLYGIDVDLRAIQLSAMALYLKVKTIDKNLSINNINLVSADVILLNGEKLQELQRRVTGHNNLDAVISKIWKNYNNMSEVGSLLRIDDEIRSIIGGVNKTNSPTLDPFLQWEPLENELLISLEEMEESSIKFGDVMGQMFTNEAEKSIHLLTYFLKKYDVVATNPPYMWKRSMGPSLRTFMIKYYPNNDGDLYSAFIDRCLDFVMNEGFVGMITQHSFMFTLSYAHLRNQILDNCKIRELIDLGPRTFEDIQGMKVNNAMFVFQKNSIKEENDNNIAKFIRLVDFQEKEIVLNEIDSEQYSKYKFKVRQKDFCRLEGCPFVYRMSNQVSMIFYKSPKLGQSIIVRSGMATGDNFRFLRYIWEVPQNEIGKRWIPYMKGGEFCQFFGNMDLVVDYSSNAQQAFRTISGARPNRGHELYFKKGITYTSISSKGFSARYMPEGFMFDVGGPVISPTNISLLYLLGLLNSSFVKYCLRVINPTVTIQPNDIRRIPYISSDERVKTMVENLTSRAIDLRKELMKFDDTYLEFKQPMILSIISQANSELIYDTYNISNEDRKNIEDEVNTTKSIKSEYTLNQVTFTKTEVQNLLSYFVFCSIGRYQLEGLEPDQDGILPRDHLFEDDLLLRIRRCFEIVFGEQREDKVIREIESILGKKIEEWLVSDLFTFHSKKYLKRPILWHLKSEKGYFHCFIYFHKLTNQTLHRLRGIYLPRKTTHLKEASRTILDNLTKARNESRKPDERKFEDDLELMNNRLLDIEKFDKTLKAIIESGYTPLSNEGVYANLKPLEKLLNFKISK